MSYWHNGLISIYNNHTPFTIVIVTPSAGSKNTCLWGHGNKTTGSPDEVVDAFGVE